MGPKKQHFWPKINISTQRKTLYFENTGITSSSKIGHDFRKKSKVQKLKLDKNVVTKNGLLNSYSQMCGFF